ncbi:MAG: DUF2203 domain-containing protein [Planctomycetota bacterium]
MPGPRVYTVEEANALVPLFVESFERLDTLRERLKTLKIKLTALEMIWGSAVHDRTCPDRAEAIDLVSQLKKVEEEFNAVLAGLGERSVAIKDVETGLLDVYHVRDGLLVHLCWKRGEAAFESWHHVDAGFAGRQPL